MFDIFYKTSEEDTSDELTIVTIRIKTHLGENDIVLQTMKRE